ncbi:MAG: NAAT family transporter [Verrucomicrobia bacterium]|nr:NAAT family transporter [Verrucomicrobiota bacterium]MDE3047484.1 NAAT family transporter [Verrucomicrobiota bacterium]
MDLAQFVNHFIGLLVIANPLSALPVVLKITRNKTIPEKRRTGVKAAFAVGLIFLIVTWIGGPLLHILGINIPAFQVAGGVIVFMLALSLLNAEESSIKHNPEENEKNSQLGAIVPLAMPIIAGPGAISTIIVQVDRFPTLFNQFLISVASLLVAFVMGVLLYFAADLEKLCGKSGINIINRLSGLILAAIAIQMLASGVLGLFPILKGDLP